MKKTKKKGGASESDSESDIGSYSVDSDSEDNISYDFENYKKVFAPEEYDQFRQLMKIWVKGDPEETEADIYYADRDIELYNFLTRLKGVT